MLCLAKTIQLHSDHMLTDGRRVVRNFLASPLLRMPPKNREKILAGGQFVHVHFVPHEQVIHLEDSSPVQIPATGIFRHATCVAKETESHAYAQATRTYVLYLKSID